MYTATFSAMCYNVLCDKYATPQLYSYCPSWALHWDYRKGAILRELREYNPDIIALQVSRSLQYLQLVLSQCWELCVQEVETDQYHKLFLPDLEQQGYSGIFAAKSRSKTMNEEERRYVDGCAIFWKTNKYVYFCPFSPNVTTSLYCTLEGLNWKNST